MTVWGGDVVAVNSIKHALSISLDPIQLINVVSDVEDDEVSVAASNTTTTRHHTSIHQNAHNHNSTRHVNPKIDAINAMTIAPSHAIADTGATGIFVMDGSKVENKRRLATKPPIVNLPDGTKVKSTHECDITIPGLPKVLMSSNTIHCLINWNTSIVQSGM